MFKELGEGYKGIIEWVGERPSLLLSSLAPIGMFVGLFGGLEGGLIIGVFMTVLGWLAGSVIAAFVLILNKAFTGSISRKELRYGRVVFPCLVGLMMGLWVFLWACVPVGLIKLATMFW